MEEVLHGLENIGVYITDCNRRIVFWNQAAEKIMGYSPREVMGISCKDNLLCHQDRHGRELCSAEFCPLYQCIQKERGSQLDIFVFGKHKNGKRIPLSVSVSPIRNREGKVVGGMEVFRNATVEWNQLKLAQNIQKKLMPDPAAVATQLPISIAWTPAEMVGGDFIQVFSTDQVFMSGIIADVSGHGTPSALLTSFLWRSLETIKLETSQPAEVLRKLAVHFQALDLGTFYFSAMAFSYHRHTGELIISSAGHPMPVLIDLQGEPAFLEIQGDLIGLFDDPKFEERRFDLTRRRIIFYTDGLVEARATDGIPMGSEPFIRVCGETARMPGIQAAQALIRQAFHYTQATEPDDDLTILMIDGEGYTTTP
jgi:PAS domain S-box-containing protein